MPKRDEFEAGAPPSQVLDMTEYSSIWDDLGVTAFLNDVKARKKLLWLIPIFWIAISNVWFFVSEDKYQGELQVIPASTGMTTSGGGLGNVLSSSGLSGLLGGGNGGNDAMFNVYIESWTAPWFAQELLNNRGLSRRIFYRKWSAETNDWKVRHAGIGTWIKGAFGARYHARSGAPDVEEMIDYLTQNLKIQHNRQEVMTFVTLQDRDPQLVRDILTYGHQQITNHLRQVYQQRAKENVAYLLNELQRVTVAEYRASLTAELAQQEKIGMMAYANQQFVSQSFGVYVADAPVFPRLGLILMGSFLLSVFGYGVCVLVVSSRFVRGRFAP